MRSQTMHNDNSNPRKVEPLPTARTFEQVGIFPTKAVYSKEKRWKAPKPETPGQGRLFDEEAARSAERSTVGPSEHRTAERCGSPLYLSIGNRCNETEEQVVRTLIKAKPCRCRKWYCPKCAAPKGRSLRHRLRERLKEFTGVYGITLTIDGALFPSPYAAWLYVMEKRSLSLFVKKLFGGGFLNSRDYFWVVEFQCETLQAHWHLLVDSQFIPFGELVAAWSSFRPKFAPQLPEKITADNYQGMAPGFGSVRFSFKKSTPHRAAGYACKYLIKVPDYGFPDWVLDHEGNVPRYGSSRGFFPPKEKKEPKAKSGKIKVHPPECMCWDCREGITRPGHQKRIHRTLRERLAQCEQSSYLTKVPLVMDDDGKLVEGYGEYIGQVSVPFSVICEEYGVESDDSVIVPSANDARLRMLEHKHSPKLGPAEDEGW